MESYYIFWFLEKNRNGGEKSGSKEYYKHG
jgi:hypothetical protein